MIEFYRPWHKPRALCFDLDDTLYANDDVIASAEIYIIDYINDTLRFENAFSREQYNSLRACILSQKPELIHDVSLLRFFIYQQLLLENNYSYFQANIVASNLVQEFINKRSMVAVPEVSLEVLNVLAQRYPLVALSNGNIELSQTPLKNIFKFELRPNINLKSKPAGDMFNLVASLLGINCCDICHIGDNEYTDVFGAINSGFCAVWFKEFKSDFRALKVLPHVSIESIKELLSIL